MKTRSDNDLSVNDLSKPPVDLPPADLTGGCTGSLASFCTMDACRNFGTEEAFQRSKASQGGCQPVVVGTCDGLFYIEESGFDVKVRWYANGDGGYSLLAVTWTTDTNAFCSNSSFSIHYGPAIACTNKVPTESLCSSD
jgi:hypothetical protein